MNKKAKCDCCEKTFNAKKLSKNKVTGQMLCYHCNNRIGSNKFYNPLTSKSNRVSKFSITTDEEKFLKTKGTNINRLKQGLKVMKEICKEKKKKEFIESKIKENKAKEINKQFIEGLK